jgi:hypothetical protein
MSDSASWTNQPKTVERASAGLAACHNVRMIRCCRSPLVFSILALVVVAGTGLGAVKFTSTWAAPDAATVSFKGQKVVALVISDDMSLRMSGEEALTRELSARGIQGVSAYKLIPLPELKDPERARGWFERGGVAGVVALRPVSQEKVKRYPPDFWATPNYSTLWGYYPYSWTTVYVVGPVPTDNVIAVESLIYQVSTGKLVWGGVSETVNPKTLQTLVADLVKEAAKKIEKQFR